MNVARSFIKLYDDSISNALSNQCIILDCFSKTFFFLNAKLRQPPFIFDTHSYFVFKILAQKITHHQERLKLTIDIGDYIYNHIKQITNNFPKNNSIKDIKETLDLIINYFVNVGYMKGAYIDWDHIDTNKWEKDGKGTFYYNMKEPIILRSAQKLYREEGFAQHISSRVIQAGLRDCYVVGCEEEGFNPNLHTKKNVQERWIIQKV
jgi:hypothetical protein